MSRPARNKLLLSAAAILVLAGVVAITQIGNPTSALSQMEGEMPAMPVPYAVVEAKPVAIWKDFSARLAAVDYVEIRPQVSGLIEKVHFTDGQTVAKGDLLYNIDPRPYAAAVSQAKADLAAANSDVVYAKKELERAEELIKTGALSKQVYDQRINATKVANNAVAAAAARVKSAQVDLDNAAIKAPIDGRISRTEITEGNLVNAANAPLLTTIVSDKDIYADFEIDEQTYLNFIRAKTSQSLESEQEVPVRMQLGGDDKWYDGKIKSFDNKINPSSGTIRARAVFANEDGALLPGMFTKVQLGSPSEDSLIAISEKAVGTDQNRKYVLVVGEGNMSEYREVHLGDSVGGERIITSGLKDGDKVITDGLMKLRPGMKVQPMTPDEMAKMQAQMAAQAQGGAPGAPPADAAAPKAEEKPVESLAPEVAAEPAPAPSEEAPPTEETTQQDVAPADGPVIELPVIDMTQPPAQEPAQE